MESEVAWVKVFKGGGPLLAMTGGKDAVPAVDGRVWGREKKSTKAFYRRISF
jgi:hypothetical protein